MAAWVAKRHNPRIKAYAQRLLAAGTASKVILTAWQNGARFDGWDDQMKMDVWNNAFKEHNVDADWFGLRERPLTEILPWVIVNDTVSEAFLKRELRRAEQERVTLSCADTKYPEGEEPCFICDACNRSPLFEKKEAMIAAPVKGIQRDAKYAKTAWTLPTGVWKADAELPKLTELASSGD